MERNSAAECCQSFREDIDVKHNLRKFTFSIVHFIQLRREMKKKKLSHDGDTNDEESIEA